MSVRNKIKFVRDCARDVKNKLKLKTVVLAAKRRGDIQKRMDEFNMLFQQCEGCSVLDIGCYDGLIAYEFFRNGVSEIHGIDNDAYHLDTAERIFSQVPIPSKFVHADLRKKKAIQSALGESLKPTYDIVLFLGVFQHVYRQMSEEAKQELVDTLVNASNSLLAIRIPDHSWAEFEKYFDTKQFALLQLTKQKGNVGEFRIYKRKRD